MASFCEKSSRWRDDTTGRYCKAPQSDSDSSSDSSSNDVQHPSVLQTAKKQLHHEAVNSTSSLKFCEKSSRWRDSTTGRYCKAPQTDNASISGSSSNTVQHPSVLQTAKKQVQTGSSASNLKFCEKSSRQSDSTTGRCCKAHQTNISSSSNSSDYIGQYPKVAQMSKKQAQPEMVKSPSNMKAPIRQEPGKIDQLDLTDGSLLNVIFEKGKAKGKGKGLDRGKAKGKGQGFAAACGELRILDRTQRERIRELEAVVESLHDDIWRAQQQHKQEVARRETLEESWQIRTELLDCYKKSLAQQNVLRESEKRDHEAEVKQLRGLVATLRCQIDNWSESRKGPALVERIAADEPGVVSPVAAVATKDLNWSPGSSCMRDWGSAASTCTGSLHDESSITVPTYLDGSWSQSSGRLVYISAVSADTLIVSNLHPGPQPEIVRLSDFVHVRRVQGDALAFGPHTGLLKGDGSMWTKLKTFDESGNAAVKKLAFSHAG